MRRPLDDCILFMPDPDGREGRYQMLNRPYGWAPCNAEQNAFLHANQESHVPAGQLRPYTDEDEGDPQEPWGGFKAFGIFVVGGMVVGKPRLCSNCFLPGHNRRTCKLPEARELVD